MSRRISLRRFIAMHPDGFRIAPYQRHYLWGQHRDGADDSVTYLTRCLIDAYRCGDRYFVQSMTVSPTHLVDGQQRVTYLMLLLRVLGSDTVIHVHYDNRPVAQAWLSRACLDDIDDDPGCESQDVYYYRRTVRVIKAMLEAVDIDYRLFGEFVLDNIELLYISLPDTVNEVAIYKMMNGTKAQMDVPDLVKADIMRYASGTKATSAYNWEIAAMRGRYAGEWDSWVRWWNRPDIRQYYSKLAPRGLDLLIKLCLRQADSDFAAPLAYGEFSAALRSVDSQCVAAKRMFERLRRTQRRFEDAYNDSAAYNRLRAIMLLQPSGELYGLLYRMMVDADIDAGELERYYKLSFLGMRIGEIARGVPASEYFDDMFASLSMPDVYHSETKKDVFNLLLRLNIDEDIKLGRKFDFSVWSNRSLEHIYSKSKVWHADEGGRIYDGNDNQLPMSRAQIERDSTYMPRHRITNIDGAQLSEHCIGNLVLLYGDNNASFGNATFEQKKMMFLAPGDRTVFQSRNLLHTVCVFAGNEWTHRSIVDNYNRTLKNLKIYYGYK